MDIYLNVPEISRRYDINIKIPAAWRLITIRELVLFISERELPRYSNRSFPFIDPLVNYRR